MDTKKRSAAREQNDEGLYNFSKNAKCLTGDEWESNQDKFSQVQRAWIVQSRRTDGTADWKWLRWLVLNSEMWNNSREIRLRENRVIERTNWKISKRGAVADKWMNVGEQLRKE
ncbi:unnamed protein product [Calypogeia fissa]